MKQNIFCTVNWIIGPRVISLGWQKCLYCKLVDCKTVIFPEHIDLKCQKKFTWGKKYCHQIICNVPWKKKAIYFFSKTHKITTNYLEADFMNCDTDQPSVTPGQLFSQIRMLLWAWDNIVHLCYCHSVLWLLTTSEYIQQIL